MTNRRSFFKALTGLVAGFFGARAAESASGPTPAAAPIAAPPPEAVSWSYGVSDPIGPVWTFTYDSAGELTSSSFHSTYSYDSTAWKKT